MGNRSAGEIAAQFEISAPAVSQHLKALRETRLVRVEVRGQQRIYTLVPESFREVDDWLQRYVRFWSNRLDRLEAAIKQGAAAASSPGAPERPARAVSARSDRDQRRRLRSAAATQTSSKGRKRKKS